MYNAAKNVGRRRQVATNKIKCQTVKCPTAFNGKKVGKVSPTTQQQRPNVQQPCNNVQTVQPRGRAVQAGQGRVWKVAGRRNAAGGGNRLWGVVGVVAGRRGHGGGRGRR